MKLADLHKKLEDWDRKGRRVFTTADLRKLFPQGKYESFLVQLRKIAAAEEPVIKRAARGIYVFNRTSQPTTNLVEEIARTILPFAEGKRSSLESRRHQKVGQKV